MSLSLQEGPDLLPPGDSYDLRSASSVKGLGPFAFSSSDPLLALAGLQPGNHLRATWRMSREPRVARARPTAPWNAPLGQDAFGRTFFGEAETGSTGKTGAEVPRHWTVRSFTGENWKKLTDIDLPPFRAMIYCFEFFRSYCAEEVHGLGSLLCQFEFFRDH